MPNVHLAGREPATAYRKIALGTWQTTYDPQIYGTMRVRMDESLRYIEAFRKKHGKKLTVTHLVAKAIGLALAKCPDANAILRFNSIWRRESIDVSILVLMEEDGKADLSAAKVLKIDQKSLLEIVEELEKRAAVIRARQDKELEKTRQSLRLIPSIFMNAFLKMLSLLLYAFNLDMRWAGLPKDALGSAVVTSIGSIGLDVAYVPLVPYSRVPIFVAPGAVKPEPVVDNGQLAVGQIMNVNATFDHRIMDGAHAAVMAKVVRAVLEKPFEHLDAL
jgi:pyruvate/2-oxoglutarate dehydrogenase complex dihydrolipoamide acyltransferase (E2) component